jgi:hypothetical protein
MCDGGGGGGFGIDGVDFQGCVSGGGACLAGNTIIADPVAWITAQVYLLNQLANIEP